MFNNIIGLKPTCGLISTRSVVPACRTLDCSSIFAETFWDAAIVLSVVSDFDELYRYLRLPSISSVVSSWIIASTFRFGIETVDTREFFWWCWKSFTFWKINKCYQGESQWWTSWNWINIFCWCGQFTL
jgi:hypothetical protein